MEQVTLTRKELYDLAWSLSMINALKKYKTNHKIKEHKFRIKTNIHA